MNPPEIEEEFIPFHIYRIAYKPIKHMQGVDIELACGSCGETKWAYYPRTGTGKLSKEQMKWKCVECGQWFICNRNQVTKILGL